jgi:hypothetical protein
MMRPAVRFQRKIGIRIPRSAPIIPATLVNIQATFPISSQRLGSSSFSIFCNHNRNHIQTWFSSFREPT